MTYQTERIKKLSYREFVEQYTQSARDFWRWRFLLGAVRCRLWYNVAFVLHCRVPDREGYFGDGHGEWCWPWQFYPKYYAVIFLDEPSPPAHS